MKKGKKKCIILGFGFGGYHFYKNLSKNFKKEHDITVIDKRNYFLFTPLLHEVAAASLLPETIIEPIRHVIDRDTKFFQTKVKEIDPIKKRIYCTEGNYHEYDILIASTGSKISHFAVPGAESFSYNMKDLIRAQKLKGRIMDVFEKAVKISDSEKRKKSLSFVVVGAGPTGVEFAGELATLVYGTMDKYYYSLLCAEELSITLVNSSDQILKAFPKKLRTEAERILQKKKVEILNDFRVSEVGKDFVLAQGGEKIPSATTIWTAGTEVNSFDNSAEIFKSKNSRIFINEFFEVEDYGDIYMIGDMARLEGGDGKAMPSTAQVARMQGVHLAKNFNRRLLGKSQKKFVFREKGMLASLGRYAAIADIKGFQFYGLPAWFMWRTIYLLNFGSWRKRLRIMVDWTINLLTRRDISNRY